ncbi:serine hydrolase [bacterium]|nr:serine hydrolase [bacterium]
MKYFTGIGLLVILCASHALSQSSAHRELPFSIPEDNIRPLRQLEDPELQKQLDAALRKSSVWASLIRKKKMAVGVVDLTDPMRIRYARVNGDVMLYAASLPKLAILLASEDALENHVLEPSEEILEDMRIMIARSDNQAASRMIDRVGFKYIENVLRRPDLELYDTKRGGGLWVGKAYSRDEKRYPDPLMGISHGATVTQVCRFYYLLAMGKLINRERSIQMLQFLSDPEIHHKFVHTYDELAPEAKLYRKSGTWKKWHSDSVLIWGPGWRRYILVALVEDSRGETILRNLIPSVESVLQSQYKKMTGIQ